jgi:glycosyltransferase involved in cell wall biosynthesis
VGGRLRIAFFGTYDERKHPRVQVLREGLTALGHQVEVVNVPLRLSTAQRVQLTSQLWRAPFVTLRLAVTWGRLLVRSRRVRRPDVVVLGYLGHLDVHLARCRWRRAHLVLDHMASLVDTVRDRHIDRSSGLVRILDLTDRAATRQADTVVVDTPEQMASLHAANRAKAVVVPVGASNAWIEAGAARELEHPASADIKGPLKVVFFGLYTPLHGALTIGSAIAKLAGHNVSWTMIGTGQERGLTEAAADGAAAAVTWVDWVDAAELPAIVADHDVCLGIFGTSPKALRVVPNKVYQGAAAGCAIVTSDTAPQRSALGDAALYVQPGNAAELARAIIQLIDAPGELAERRRAARAIAERHFTPNTVVEGLAAALTGVQHERMARTTTPLPPLAPNAALRWQVVRERLDQVEPASVLELGAGQGAFAARLAARATYVGVEPDITSQATATSRLEPSNRVIGGIDELAADEQFDLACAFEVLEHIDDHAGVLSQWVDHVRPGGHVLVSVPAEPDRFGPADEMAGHYRRYTHDDLGKLFASAGLEVVSVEHYGYPLGNLLEVGRNVIGRRRLAKARTPDDLADRTAASGRLLQPPTWAGRLIWYATAPGRYVQRRFPTRGPGLVGLARKPT